MRQPQAAKSEPSSPETQPGAQQTDKTPGGTALRADGARPDPRLPAQDGKAAPFRKRRGSQDPDATNVDEAAGQERLEPVQDAQSLTPSSQAAASATTQTVFDFDGQQDSATSSPLSEGSATLGHSWLLADATGVAAGSAGSGTAASAAAGSAAATQAVAAGSTGWSIGSGLTAALGAAAGVAVVAAVMADTTPPTLRISSSAQALKAGETALITFSFSEKVKSFELTDIAVSGGALSELQSLDSGRTFTAVFTPTANLAATSATLTVADASYSDNAGNPGSGATLAPMAIDTQAPSLQISSSQASVKGGETALISLRFSEKVQGFELADLSLSAGTGVLSDLQDTDGGQNFTALFTPTADLAATTSTISVLAAAYRDLAGNAGTAGQLSALPVDTRAPLLLSITSAASGLGADTSTAVTFSFSEKVIGFDLSDVSVTAGTLSDLRSSDGGQTLVATLTPDADLPAGSSISLSVADQCFTDLLGNTGSGASMAALPANTSRPGLLTITGSASSNTVSLSFDQALDAAAFAGSPADLAPA